MTTPDHIQRLHGLYCSLTGFTLRLDMLRESTWFEWLRRGFTADDLQTMIRHLRREIRDGRRNPGALKFSNLIGQPDSFEEDLAAVRAILRSTAKLKNSESVLSRVVRVGNTERRLPDQPPTDAARSSAEVLASPAFKDFIALKKNL